MTVINGLCSSSVMAALALMTVITQLLLWDKLLSSLLYLGQVQTSPYKGLTHIQYTVYMYDRSHVALIAQLGEYCTGITEVMGLNPAQSLKIFSGLCSSSVMAALPLMTVITQFTMGQITFNTVSGCKF